MAKAMNGVDVKTIGIEKGAVLLDDKHGLPQAKGAIKLERGKFGERPPSHRQAHIADKLMHRQALATPCPSPLIIAWSE
jgi:hypothetical protein